MELDNLSREYKMVVTIMGLDIADTTIKCQQLQQEKGAFALNFEVEPPNGVFVGASDLLEDLRAAEKSGDEYTATLLKDLLGRLESNNDPEEVYVMSIKDGNITISTLNVKRLQFEGVR